jgi:predicted nucleic acid-binding protein
VSYWAVLDANVLFPASLRDLVLRFAEREFYTPFWSERILREALRNMQAKRGLTDEQVENLLGQIHAAFPEAMIDAAGVEAIEDQMGNDPGDRHVLATAVVAGAEGIVTFNLKHFPDDALAQFDKQAIHPEDFLGWALERHPDEVLTVIQQQASDLKNPPHTPADILDYLQLGGVPRFVEAVRNPLGLPPRTDGQILAERQQRA